MTEPENARQPSKEEELRELALLFSKILTDARDKLEAALNETDSIAGLRLRVRDVSAILKSTVHAVAEMVEKLEGKIGSEGEDHA
jgi:hypothetical protein